MTTRTSGDFSFHVVMGGPASATAGGGIGGAPVPVRVHMHCHACRLDWTSFAGTGAGSFTQRPGHVQVFCPSCQCQCLIPASLFS